MVQKTAAFLSADKLKREVRESLSKIGSVSKVDLEGPFVVVYVDDPAEFLNGDGGLAEVAKSLKKRIILMSKEPKKNQEEALKIIKAVIPERAELVDAIFVKETREVYIIAKRTGYVVGKAGSNIAAVLRATGWRPIVIRAPALRSPFLDTLQRLIVDGAVERKRNLKRIAKRIYRKPMGVKRGVYASFLGGAREVGRSSILLHTDESSVLLDAGIGVGGGGFFPRYDSPDFHLDELDAVIVTHAHLDHSGALPLLAKYGYRGPIYVTKPTRDLVALLLYDYINLSARIGSTPFFSERDVRTIMNHMVTLDYGETVDISPDIKLTLYKAGHILGSAMAHLNIVGARHNILYTGDFRFRDSKLLDRADSRFPRLETLIMECTYGGEKDVLPPPSDAEAQLLSIINETIERGGKVLIPALSVGRAQEIMLVLVEAFNRGELPDVPVYIDGMAYDATAIHTAYPDYLSGYVRNKVFKEDSDPFTDPHISAVNSQDDRESVIQGGPSVIISPSGMLAGGPSVEYFRALAGRPENAVILVSYQPQGTLGRRLRDGAKEVTIRDGTSVERIKVQACVCSVEGFSAHADKVQLLSFITSISPKPKNIFLVHGEERKMHSFRRLVSKAATKLSRLGMPSIMERVRIV